MTLDRFQDFDEKGRAFGYIAGDDGGWFFTHMDTLDDTLYSLEEDEVDGNGGITPDEAYQFLLERLTARPLESFA